MTTWIATIVPVTEPVTIFVVASTDFSKHVEVRCFDLDAYFTEFNLFGDADLAGGLRRWESGTNVVSYNH